jgi:hypothetical protein
VNAPISWPQGTSVGYSGDVLESGRRLLSFTFSLPVLNGRACTVRSGEGRLIYSCDFGLRDRVHFHSLGMSVYLSDHGMVDDLLKAMVRHDLARAEFYSKDGLTVIERAA